MAALRPEQLRSNRDATRYENETLRYDADTTFRDWKSKVTDLQSQMRDNQIALRKANRRFAQVAAQGGSGDYGINTYSSAADNLRKEISGSRSGASFSPAITGKGFQSVQTYQDDINQNQQQVDLANKRIADEIARQNPKATPAQLQQILSEAKSEAPRGRSPLGNFVASQLQGVTGNQQRIDENKGLIPDQQQFETEELGKAQAYEDSIKRQEADFINALLDAPLPEATSLRGFKETFTPQQISAKRDAAINSSMTAQSQNVAPQSNQVYLAKQQKTSPLAGFNVSNMKSAKQRVSGATLGGNSNRLTA